MARFNFKLQVVLDQREREEQLAQMNHARAQLAQKQLEADLAKVEADLLAANEHMRDHHLVGKIDTTMIATHRRFLIAMRTNVIALAQRIAAARLVSETARRKLAVAAKDKRAIETLRDRQKQRWLADQDRKDLALADDVAMQIAYHNLTAEAVAGGAA
jgi:flagellar FliJ protein